MDQKVNAVIVLSSFSVATPNLFNCLSSSIATPPYLTILMFSNSPNDPKSSLMGLNLKVKKSQSKHKLNVKTRVQ